jgi:CRP-like cAMP-binding protein
MMIASALQTAPAFHGLNTLELAEIASHATDRRLIAGEALFQQGASVQRFFLIAEGCLKVTMVTSDGKQVFVGLASPGDFCGMAPVTARPDHAATARAVLGSRVLAWPASYWAPLIETYPRIAVRLTEAIGRELDEVHDRIAELATEDVERRVAHAVLRLANRAGQQEEDGGIAIRFPVTRQDIAEMTGTTLYNVSRIVSGWSARGIVRRGRARIVISDVAALERIARGDED